MVVDTRHDTDGQVIACGYCPRQVVFWPTNLHGHALCFDAQPIPSRADRERHGWMPGVFYVEGALRRVHAPWQDHPYDARRRAGSVWLLHACSGQTRAVAA